MCCRAFSPEKKNGKRGFNMMVINGTLFLIWEYCSEVWQHAELLTGASGSMLAHWNNATVLLVVYVKNTLKAFIV